MGTMTVRYPISSYKMIVHEAEEGGYWGELVELPGCVSQGETLEELGNNMKEALEAILEAESDRPHVVLQTEPTQEEKDFVEFSMPQTGNATPHWTSTKETWTATAQGA